MIDTEKDNRKLVERAFLIGIQDKETTQDEAEEHIEELEELVDSMGVPVVGKKIINLKKLSAKYLMGSGKAEEVFDILKEYESDCIVFDYELSPSQQRNWEKLTKLCVIDRHEVILDIFANRATTREAVLQVEMARMKYALPRLTRAWTHLSRQRGGNKGTRGEGEQQIEVDRRLVQDKINRLKRELAEVSKQRKTQRKSREKSHIPHIAIVGYTNAGKSSLLNKLSGADILVEDKLFATLDPTTRQISLPDSQKLLLTDTVGFVRKLPHDLVEAFKSTLEEAAYADFLIIVLDASNEQVEEHWKTTLSVLDEIGAGDKKRIVVHNKMDLVGDDITYEKLRFMQEEPIFISVKQSEGIEELHKAIIEEIKNRTTTIKVAIPASRYDLISFAHENANILSSEYDDNGINIIKMNINNIFQAKYKGFIVL